MRVLAVGPLQCNPIILADGDPGAILRPLAGYPLVAYCAAAAFQSHSVGKVGVVGDAAVVDAVDSFCAAQSDKPALQIAQRSKARHVLSAHSHRRARDRTGNATPLTAVSQSNFDIH